MRITRGRYAECDEQTQQAIIARSGMQNVIGDEMMLSAVPLTISYDMSQMWIHTVPPDMRLTNECECCHRGDLQERVAASWDEAVEYGWLIPVADDDEEPSEAELIRYYHSGGGEDPVSRQAIRDAGRPGQ